MSENMFKDFVNAQKEFGPALKSSLNPHFRSKYADLSACIEAVVDALNNNNFALTQKNIECEAGIAVETVFLHESGSFISSGILRVPAQKNDAQGYGSALTYARRYSLMTACGIAPEDDDGNNASKNISNLKKTIYEKPVKVEKTEENPLIFEALKIAEKGTEIFKEWANNLEENEKNIIREQKSKLWEKAKNFDNLNRIASKFDGKIE